MHDLLLILLYIMIFIFCASVINCLGLRLGYKNLNLNHVESYERFASIKITSDSFYIVLNQFQ